LKPVDKLDIDEYKDTKEKIKIDDSIIQTVNGTGNPIDLSPSVVEADTVAVDSVPAN
jgi:vacuolar-type H+-ATPase subunit B/Vma2